MSAHSKLQQDYIDDMKALIPTVVAWWEEKSGRSVEDYLNSDTANDFETRWPSGPAGHPRVLKVFRDYYFRLNDLNFSLEEAARLKDAEKTRGELWEMGEDDGEFEFVPPLDFLISDLEDREPELFLIVQGIVFIPIGIGDEPRFC